MPRRHQKPIMLGLVAALIVSSCAPSIVQIREPYFQKLRPGDGVKIRVKSGTLHAGRVVYLDQKVVVIRTPRQRITDNPVRASRFGTTIPWETIHSLKVAGTLDSRRKLISNEEIRINRKTNLREKLMVNAGLLGLATSFLIGAAIQEHMAPADPNNLTGNHGRARFTFWSVMLGGTAASVVAGRQIGSYLDDRRAIGWIERSRALLRAQRDSLNLTNEATPYGTPLANKP